MKKLYTVPSMTVIEVDTQDIMTTSGGVVISTLTSDFDNATISMGFDDFN